MNTDSLNAVTLVKRLHDYRYDLCDCDDKKICTPHQIVDGCIDIVLDMVKDPEKVEAQASEICDDEAMIQLLRPYLHFGTSGWRRVAEKCLETIRPYLRTTEPVSVSLEKCGDALAEAWNLKYPRASLNKGAKAVLDAAGVKYVD